MTTISSAAWTPPEKPDPEKILDEAEDAAPGGEEEALAKFEWFYQNARKYQVGFLPVFAFSGWAKLGKNYPPALASMRKFRDLATTAAKPSNIAWTASLEIFSFDRDLEDNAHAVEFYTWLDANRPDVAKATFPYARFFLIAEKKFDLCARYLDAEVAFKTIESVLKDHAVTTPGTVSQSMHDSILHEIVIRDSAELVALLVITGKKADADTYAAKALELLPGNDALASALEESKKGTLPPEL